MSARRIQRKRTRGWRMPEGAVYVGRPTRWGNPYSIGECGAAADAVAYFREDLLNGCWRGLTVEDVQRELRGKDLACWCSLSMPCHADVLLEIANAEEPT